LIFGREYSILDLNKSAKEKIQGPKTLNPRLKIKGQRPKAKGQRPKTKDN